ncbi:MAG TPA: PLP-dependent aminotransferase family protein [Dongiaceae bacterium]|nr:PLP-dependent aminotransferase family protein [Dongiaceae bacterium]
MELHISLVGRKDLGSEIYRQLRQAILAGQLRPGDPLPPSRELARRLTVSRSTVTGAYDRLAGEGFVTAHVGAGTIVSEHLVRTRGKPKHKRIGDTLRGRRVWDAIRLPPVLAELPRFDFRSGIPDATLFPHDLWRRLMARQLRAEAKDMIAYDAPAGNRGLREAIARHIGVSRGVEASVDDVIVTNGTQQAMDVVARALLSPGDHIAVEDPGYGPVRSAFTALGLRVRGVPVDGDGLDVEAIPKRARAIYVTPSHQYPLGVSMTLPRRLALLAWADRHNAALIEDDYDSEFRFGGRPIEPLRMLDKTGRVIYVGSFSKTLLPTLRLGFIVAPPSLRDTLHKAKFVADWHTPTTVQAAAANFIDNGGFARHIRKMREVYRTRHRMIVDALRRDFATDLNVIPSTVGLHIAAMARTASTDKIGAIVRRASDAGVVVQELSRFAVNAPGLPGLVLGYGAIPTARIEAGLQRLRSCFHR